MAQNQGTAVNTVELGQTPMGGRIMTHAIDGSAAVDINITSSGSGGPGAGLVFVNDRFGNFTIALDCSTGTVAAYDFLDLGALKDINHRGKGKLVNGKVVIILPEDFTQGVDENEMNIKLTPRCAESEELAVVFQSKAEIHVKELRNGKGNYAFDFAIHAVKKEVEDLQKVYDQLIEKASPFAKEMTADQLLELSTEVINGGIQQQVDEIHMDTNESENSKDGITEQIKMAENIEMEEQHSVGLHINPSQEKSEIASGLGLTRITETGKITKK